MKFSQHLFLATVVVSSFVLGCADDPVVPPAASEFIAKNSDFANYKTWAKTTAQLSGLDPSGLLKGAHEEADTSFKRNVYISNASATITSGNYPVGTIIVKHMKSPSKDLGMAMVKRGGAFNPTHKGWEWLVLTADGTIEKDAAGAESRGANLMGGMCNGCHSAVSTKDYVFTK